VWYTSYMRKMSQQIPGQEANTCSTHAPMQRAMSLIGDMWTLMIVYNLLSGPRRFGELREAMGNVSPKTVSQRLKMLEEDGFVDRHAFAEIPPRVVYQLTEKGQALADIIEAIGQFSERYLSDGERASMPSSVAPSQSCH
jgi:DNA-binding HxlR family transcriptional regulator